MGLPPWSLRSCVARKNASEWPKMVTFGATWRTFDRRPVRRRSDAGEEEAGEKEYVSPCFIAAALAQAVRRSVGVRRRSASAPAAGASGFLSNEHVHFREEAIRR
jgi:hypothetical protein